MFWDDDIASELTWMVEPGNVVPARPITLSGANVSSGSTSVTVTWPTAGNFPYQAGDLFLLFVANKYPTNGPTTPTGFTLGKQVSGGHGSSGPDAGSVYVTGYYKVSDGSEVAGTTFAVSIPSGNSACTYMVRYLKDAIRTWDVGWAGGSMNTPGTAWSVTGDGNPDYRSGDIAVTYSGINTDARTFTVESLAATGCTFGTMLEGTDAGTPTGDDSWGVVSFQMASGLSTAAPVFTMTASGSSTDEPAGATVFARVRLVPP